MPCGVPVKGGERKRAVLERAKRAEGCGAEGGAPLTGGVPARLYLLSEAGREEVLRACARSFSHTHKQGVGFGLVNT